MITIIYDQSDAAATINFSTQYGGAIVSESRAVTISFSAWVSVATIYSNVPVPFSPVSEKMISIPSRRRKRTKNSWRR